MAAIPVKDLTLLSLADLLMVEPIPIAHLMAGRAICTLETARELTPANKRLPGSPPLWGATVEDLPSADFSISGGWLGQLRLNFLSEIR